MNTNGHELRLLCIVTISALLLLGCGQQAEVMDSEKGVEQGWELFRMGEYGAAVSAFERAVDQLPVDDPGRLMALYGLAMTWNLQMPVGNRDGALARELYGQVMEMAPESDLASWSALALVRMDHLRPVGEEPDLTVIRPAYAKIVARYPQYPAGEEAFLYLQSTYVAEMTPATAEQAAAALEEFVQANPDSGYRSAAYGLLQTCYELLNEPEKQLRCLIMELESREIDPSNPAYEKSWAYWRIATVAEFEAGDLETARKYHRLLLEEYPKDSRGFAAEVALKRMDDVEAGLRDGTWSDGEGDR